MERTPEVIDIPIYSREFGIPIGCYVNIHNFDVSKISIEPSWQFRDKEGVHDTGAAQQDGRIFERFDYEVLPTEIGIYKGLFNVRFKPGDLKQGYHGSYEIQVIMKMQKAHRLQNLILLRLITDSSWIDKTQLRSARALTHISLLRKNLHIMLTMIIFK